MTVLYEYEVFNVLALNHVNICYFNIGIHSISMNRVGDEGVAKLSSSFMYCSVYILASPCYYVYSVWLIQMQISD